MRIGAWILAVVLQLPLAATAKQPPSELADLVEKLLPAVVNVITVTYVPIDDKQPATNPILKKKNSTGLKHPRLSIFRT